MLRLMRTTQTAEGGSSVLGWTRLGRLAARTAQALGLAPEEAEECQLITLAGLLGRSSHEGEAGELYRSLPVRSRHLLELALERCDATAAGQDGLKADEIPLAARIAAPLIGFPGTSFATLLSKAPGAFDPNVVAAWSASIRPPRPPHTLDGGGRGRSTSEYTFGGNHAGGSR